MSTKPATDTELLLACAGGRAAAAAAAAVDWERVLALAGVHRLGPLLACRLRGAGAGAVPAAVRAQLEALYLTAAARGTRLLAELQRVLALLAAAGIDALPLRGPVLARQLYPDPLARSCDDLDLLLHAGDLPRARAALVADGYAAVRGVPTAAAARFLRAGGALMLKRAAGGHELDLHGMLEPRAFLAPVTLCDLQPARIAVAAEGGGVLPALEPGMLLLTLCVHGAKHGWSRHLWTADVAALLARHGATLDWTRVLAEAQRRGWRRMLLVGVAWAARARGEPLPEPLRRAAQGERALPALLQRLEDAFAADPAWVPRDDAARARLHLALFERRRDQVRYVARRAFTPSHNDWRAVTLPPALAWAYPVLRPLRLAARYLRATRS